MKIIKAKDYNAASRMAANIIAAQVILKPDCVLGLATGSTPIGTYESLIERYKNGDLDFSQVSSINLDEYKGLSPENDQSYRYFMNEHLFNHINIDKNRTHVPNGLEPDSENVSLHLWMKFQNRRILWELRQSCRRKKWFFLPQEPEKPKS